MALCYWSRNRHSAECIAVMGSSAKGMLKGRAGACETKWSDSTGLLLRLPLQARYGLLKITLIIVNCTLNLKLWFSQPASQLWKQMTMSLLFLPCDFLANVIFLLPSDTLITSSVHPLEDLCHSLPSFVWEFCNMLSLNRPLFFPLILLFIFA